MRDILDAKKLKPVSDRRHYDEKFKKEVIRSMVLSGDTLSQTAIYTGIEQSILYRWKKKYIKELFPETQQDSYMSEYAEIRKEVDELKLAVNQLRSIVKKCFGDKYNAIKPDSGNFG